MMDKKILVISDKHPSRKRLFTASVLAALRAAGYEVEMHYPDSRITGRSVSSMVVDEVPQVPNLEMGDAK